MKLKAYHGRYDVSFPVFENKVQLTIFNSTRRDLSTGPNQEANRFLATTSNRTNLGVGQLAPYLTLCLSNIDVVCVSKTVVDVRAATRWPAH
jgi:hypothetical protein